MPPSIKSKGGDLSSSTVCVLYGGRSSEREVSLLSGRCILKALQASAGKVQKSLAVEIDTNGHWLVDGEALLPGAALLELPAVDVFFLGLHGADGEDGLLQGFLSLHHKKFTGSGVCASALAMDKEFTRRIVGCSGLTLAPGRNFNRAEWGAQQAELLARFGSWGNAGWVVKPTREGSSVGISVLRELDRVPAAVEIAFTHGEQVLVEQRIEGVEVAAAVLSRPDGSLEALPIVEICPKPGRFFDYEEKYSATGAKEHCPPIHLDPSSSLALQELARQAHRALGCTGYSRSDFIVPAQGAPVFLELNTLPGMTPRSLFPLAAGVAGISFEELCLRLAQAGLAEPGPNA